jgi:tetratricopeptide (TPR) repeat protein
LFKAVKLEQTGDINEAERIYYRLIEQYPEFTSGWTTLGIFLFNQGKIDAAIDLMKIAAKQLESSAEPLNQLGDFLRSEERDEEALEAYRAAVERDPSHVSSWSGIIDALKALGRADGFETAYNSILKVRPEDAMWLEQFGDFLWHQKRNVEAEELLRTAIESNHRFYRAWVKLGVVLYNQQKYVESLDAFHSATSIEPHTEYAYNLLGRLLEEQGLVDSLYSSILETVHPLATRHFTRIVSINGNITHAILQYRELANSNPDSTLIWHYLGVCHLAQSNYEEAEKVFRRITEFNPDSIEAWSDLGISLIKQNLIEEGRQAIRRALSIGSPDTSTKFLEVLL